MQQQKSNLKYNDLLKSNIEFITQSKTKKSKGNKSGREINLPNEDIPRKTPVKPKASGESTKGRK